MRQCSISRPLDPATAATATATSDGIGPLALLPTVTRLTAGPALVKIHGGFTAWAVAP